MIGFILGAHAVGRCHTDRSGFWGPWSRAEATLSNEYFRLMFEEKWTEKKTHKGKEWKGPVQYENKEGQSKQTFLEKKGKKYFHFYRCEQGSNLCGKIPLDFKSNALTTRPSQLNCQFCLFFTVQYLLSIFNTSSIFFAKSGGW